MSKSYIMEYITSYVNTFTMRERRLYRCSFFFSSRRRHTRLQGDWSSDVCSSDLPANDRPYVLTKAGLVWDDRNRAAPPRRVGDPLSIRRELEASLRRLEVERIDLYQMHWPAEDGIPLEDYWGTLLQLKAEGKVRAVGLSNHDVRQLDAAERLGHVGTLQPPLSAIRREVAAAELPWCAAHRTGAIG